MVENVAKTKYKKAGNEVGLKSRAAVTALWYILIGKKSRLITLYNTEPENQKVANLLAKDFEEEKVKK